jgi:hypothetical protein
LVGLDEEQVIALLADNLGTDVALTEHSIAQDDAALDGQNAQQFQSRLVLVGLGVDFDLAEDGFDEGGVGGDQVLSGDFTVAAAPQVLAVEGDGLFGGRDRFAGADPACQGGLEGDGVEATQESG